jgi:branched-chain amino acid transport system permease protein
VTPTQLNVLTSAEALLMVTIGGAGTMVGPFLGAIIVVLLEFVVSAQQWTLFNIRVGERWVMVLGLIYIGVVLFAPNGLYPLVRAVMPGGPRRGGGSPRARGDEGPHGDPGL